MGHHAQRFLDNLILIAEAPADHCPERTRSQRRGPCVPTGGSPGGGASPNEPGAPRRSRRKREHVQESTKWSVIVLFAATREQTHSLNLENKRTWDITLLHPRAHSPSPRWNATRGALRLPGCARSVARCGAATKPSPPGAGKRRHVKLGVVTFVTVHRAGLWNKAIPETMETKRFVSLRSSFFARRPWAQRPRAGPRAG